MPRHAGGRWSRCAPGAERDIRSIRYDPGAFHCRKSRRLRARRATVQPRLRPAASYRLRIALAVLLSVFACASLAQADQSAQQKQTQEKLEKVRRELALLAQARQLLAGERNDASQALREADVLVNEQTRALDAIEVDIARQTAELARLDARRTQLEKQLSGQRQALAELVRSAYALGRHEQLKLLLAQDRIESLARVMAYHRYFQQGRITKIQTLMQQMQELSAVAAQITTQQEKLAQSHAAQQEKLAQLESQRGQRRELLRELEGRFRDTQSRIEALGRDEKALAQLLDQLQDIFADIPDAVDAAMPFAKRRGKLPAPLPGKVEVRYGGTLPDGRQSQGWLLAAKAGDPVRAVAHGRVAFADWLKGYGLIVIVDHGDGYMSLYAQNDSLRSEAGDWVKPGDVLALAGSSGGQGAPALYFELRRNSEPIDPKPWFPPR